MLQLTWLFLGALAAVMGGVAMQGSLPRYLSQLLAAFSAITWGFWAVQATNVQTVSNGTTVTHSYVGAMLLGLIAAALMLLLVVESVFGWFGLADSGVDQNAT